MEHFAHVNFNSKNIKQVIFVVHFDSIMAQGILFFLMVYSGIGGRPIQSLVTHTDGHSGGYSGSCRAVELQGKRKVGSGHRCTPNTCYFFFLFLFFYTNSELLPFSAASGILLKWFLSGFETQNASDTKRIPIFKGGKLL